MIIFKELILIKKRVKTKPYLELNGARISHPRRRDSPKFNKTEISKWVCPVLRGRVARKSYLISMSKKGIRHIRTWSITRTSPPRETNVKKPQLPRAPLA